MFWLFYLFLICIYTQDHRNIFVCKIPVEKLTGSSKNIPNLLVVQFAAGVVRTSNKKAF
jgi:hypothetical protein